MRQVLWGLTPLRGTSIVVAQGVCGANGANACFPCGNWPREAAACRRGDKFVSHRKTWVFAGFTSGTIKGAPYVCARLSTSNAAGQPRARNYDRVRLKRRSCMIRWGEFR